ncbi:tetratricopeptide repeat protein [Mucilaginibacter segetis]|uniref:Tetratricopeptide repeat protein n=1 Tax=Mucilaginibacter segetis TaxID=2793071 RepID=A0A934PUX0_9SPHI|nr:tetratricopeptide repeat protein [Mucilaginibacter segetis]MBK0379468.1 hypothetical protein [Mucilaginibacter segetis]
MKIKILMVGLLGLITATTFAQKKELSTAQAEYDKYLAFKDAQKALAVPSLEKAKEAIDKAAANDKTAQLAQTYALKGAVYSAYAENDTIANTSAQYFNTAQEALKKAKELDEKGEYKGVVDNAYRALANNKIKEGVAQYKAGNYDGAYKAFDFYRSVAPNDTTALLYTGLSAYNAGNYAAAIDNYKNLVNTDYSDRETIYDEMSSAYLFNKDTTGALNAITQGLTKFPSSSKLRKKEIEISLQSGKQKEVLNKILSAINNDPQNKSLYYYAGLVYSQTADDAVKQLKDAKTPADKTKLDQIKTENFAKAAEMYKKALAIDPDYFEANLNMGYVVIAPAIEIYNAAVKLPANKQKEYEAAIAKANVQFDLAKPYLLKAVELNPKSIDALTNLMTYYSGKQDSANVAKIKKQIDELNQK